MIVAMVLATAALSAAIVFTSIRDGKQRPTRVLRTDANWHRAAATAEASFFQSVDDVDEILGRPDSGSDQHG